MPPRIAVIDDHDKRFVRCDAEVWDLSQQGPATNKKNGHWVIFHTSPTHVEVWLSKLAAGEIGQDWLIYLDLVFETQEWNEVSPDSWITPIDWPTTCNPREKFGTCILSRLLCMPKLRALIKIASVAEDAREEVATAGTKYASTKGSVSFVADRGGAINNDVSPHKIAADIKSWRNRFLSPILALSEVAEIFVTGDGGVSLESHGWGFVHNLLDPDVSADAQNLPSVTDDWVPRTRARIEGLLPFKEHDGNLGAALKGLFGMEYKDSSPTWCVAHRLNGNYGLQTNMAVTLLSHFGLSTGQVEVIGNFVKAPMLPGYGFFFVLADNIARWTSESKKDQRNREPVLRLRYETTASGWIQTIHIGVRQNGAASRWNKSRVRDKLRSCGWGGDAGCWPLISGSLLGRHNTPQNVADNSPHPFYSGCDEWVSQLADAATSFPEDGWNWNREAVVGASPKRCAKLLRIEIDDSGLEIAYGC